MSRDDIIQNVKDAKFQIEFMALMLLRQKRNGRSVRVRDHQAGTNRKGGYRRRCLRDHQAGQIVGEDSDV